MTDKQSTKPPAGTRDFLPDDIRRRAYVIDVVRGVYERYGFEPLETPAFENIETLLGKYGEEGNKLIFKILRRGEHEASGEADLALRYDLTVPLARVVAQYQAELPKFFKRYQIQPVWRADRPARGRFREFYQCDVDAIGSTSPVVEAEMIAAVSDVLQTLGFHDFTIRLNHRAVLSAILHGMAVAEARHGDVLIGLDKLDKIGPDGVAKDLAGRGIEPHVAYALLDAFADKGANAETLDALQHDVGSNVLGLAGVQQLRDIVRLSAMTSASNHLVVNPSLARGLSYYTGAIMEIAVEGIGSLGGGGRYDGLIGMFAGEQIPACGFSLGLERILVVMGERGMFPDSVQASGPDVLVTIFDAPLAAESLQLARELRGAGLRVEVYPEALRSGKDLGKAFKYADTRKARCVAVMGQDELGKSEVKIKDLSTGQQETVARGTVASSLAHRLSDIGHRVSDPRLS